MGSWGKAMVGAFRSLAGVKSGVRPPDFINSLPAGVGVRAPYGDFG